MATFYITCRTMAYVSCRHEHVKSVCFFTTETGQPKRFTATREEMIQLLAQGNTAETYPDPATVRPASVYVVHCSRGVPYLTTYPDATKANNLDELKICTGLEAL